MPFYEYNKTKLAGIVVWHFILFPKCFHFQLF